MATASAEDVVRRLFEEWSANRETAEVYARLFAPDFVCHGPPGINHSHEAGHENCVFYIFKNCFDRLSFQVGEVRTEDERVIAHFTVRGRQVEPFRDIAPRESECVFHGLTIFRVEGDRIAEGWGSVNWG